MTKSTRSLWVLVAAVAIFALALSAVAPVLAQAGTGGDSGQGGNSVALESGDTLGTLVSRYNLSGDNLNQFFSANSGLVLQEGQAVAFPEGVTVDLADDSQNYTTVAGDTLGVVLGKMGFTANTSSGAMGTDQSGTTGTDQSGTTGTDQSGTDQSGTTGTDQSGTTGTDQSGTTGTDQSGTAGSDQSGQSGAGSQAVSNDQLQQFVDLNSGLVFVDGQTVMLPAAIPQTGEGQTGTDQSGTTGTDQSGTTGTDQSGTTGTDQSGTTGTDQSGTTGTDQSGQQGQSSTYTVQAGDTLPSIADQYGISLEQLIELNPNLLTAGQTINVPAGQGNIPQTGNQEERSYDVVSGDTLSAIISRFNLQNADLREFFRANSDLQVQAGQTIQIPQGLNQSGVTGADQSGSTGTDQSGTTGSDQSGSTGTDQSGTTGTDQSGQQGQANNTYVTEEGDTLGDVFDAIGLNLDDDSLFTNNQSGTTGTDQSGTTGTDQSGTTGTDQSGTTGTDQSGTTGTDQSGTTGTDQSGTTGSDQSAQQGQGDQILGQFVSQNGNLVLVEGQTVTVPAGIPQTGAQGQAGQGTGTGTGTGAGGNSGNVVVGEGENVGQGGRFGRFCGVDATPGTGHYLIQPGESLQSIATRFNVDPQDIIDLNPGVSGFFSGQVIVLPGVEAPGQWNNAAIENSCNNLNGGNNAGENSGE